MVNKVEYYVNLMLADCRDGDWWYVEHTNDGRRGYIPVNYVAELNSIRQFEYVRLSCAALPVLRVRPSVCPSVCPVPALARKRKWRRKTKIGVNMFYRTGVTGAQI